MRSLTWYAVNRGYLYDRLLFAVDSLLGIDRPWIAPAATRYCAANLTRTMEGFEWGSGRSTTWFGTRLRRLTSVEHDPRWHRIVQARIAARGIGDRVRCLLVGLDHSSTEPTRPHYAVRPAYVAAIDGVPNGSLDLVVVDGHYRQACVIAALPKLRPGGMLLVDNTDWIPSDAWNVPTDWVVVLESRYLGTQTTTVWRKPQ